MIHQHTEISPCRFVAFNGVTIHLIARYPDDESTSGPAVLFIHGGQAWAYTWRYQLEFFDDAGYQVIAPDLPGSGYSDLREFDTSIEGLSRFLGNLLDVLGIKQAAFVASSAGGLPVLDFAIRYPQRVAALVLASTCGVPHSEPLLWKLVRWPLVGEVMRLFLTKALVRSNLRDMVYDDSLITNEVVSAYYDSLHRSGAWAAQLRLERNWRPGWVETHIQQISAPTLVVWVKTIPTTLWRWRVNLPAVSPGPSWKSCPTAATCPTRNTRTFSIGWFWRS
jgi:pimeloyl-ACP methyl ester carboxylesterase